MEASEEPPEWLKRFIQQRHAQREAYDWLRHARAEQLPPEWGWTVWLLFGGRGSGKTRAASEFIRHRANRARSGNIALVGRTAADVRDVMIEGPSGLLAIHPRHERPTYSPTMRRLEWPNGVRAQCYTADEPDQILGSNNETGWLDEFEAYPNDAARRVWRNFRLSLRIGDPRAVLSCTPRPQSVLKDLLRRKDRDVAVSHLRTYDNRDNLSDVFFSEIVSEFEGTLIGERELEGRMVDALEGALWTDEMLEAARTYEKPEGLRRIVVGVDPATSSNIEAATTGIVGAGVDRVRRPNGYVLGDFSKKGRPQEWGRAAVRAYYSLNADRIVAEKNQGGEMVRETIHSVDSSVPVKLVHASRGKLTRAEPISALYEQGRVKHSDHFKMLEAEMLSYDGSGDSPDRMDALVWALTELMVGSGKKFAKPIWGRNG